MRQSFHDEFSELISGLAQYKRSRLWEMYEEMDHKIAQQKLELDGLQSYKAAVDDAVREYGYYKP